MGCIHGVDNDGKTPVEQHVCDICGNSYGHKWRYFLSKHSYLGYSYTSRIEGEGGREGLPPRAQVLEWQKFFFVNLIFQKPSFFPNLSSLSVSLKGR